MQRLFSTFANGLPGIGLLIQRLAAGAALIHAGVAQWSAPSAGLMIPEMAGALLGSFIVAGLWTPVAGTLVAAVEVWVLLAGGWMWMPLILGVMGGTLAMIGPGARSVDARLFGRKHIAG